MNVSRQSLHQTPSLKDVWEARKRITTVVRKTPLVFSPRLSEITGTSVYLKLENLQDTGSFKVRGAANKILSLKPDDRERGVATFSTGNHGMAVAHIARSLGIPAVICMSRHVPESKAQAIRQLGARLEIVGDSQDDAEQYCYRLEQEQGLSVIKPFDDFHVVAGQGTIGLELLEELPQVNMVIAGLSGGGLVGGIGLALKYTNPESSIIGVSMEQSAVMHESLKAGKPIQMKESPTLADSLLGGIGLDNLYTFSIIRRYMDKSYLVPEEVIAEGMAYLLENHRIAVEGAAAVGAGAILRGIVKPGSHTVLVISGCNIGLQDFLQATRPYIHI